MITKTELIKSWADIIPQHGQTVGRRADPQHPLDFFITYDEKAKMQLMLLTEHQLSLPNSSKQINVRGNQRADNKKAVCFSLEDDKLKDQFVSLCWDIMDCSFEIENKKTAAQAVIKRFKMWQKLFAETKTKRMSETEVKGLLGELCVLKDILVPKYGLDKAVSGWVGPLGTDRDFEFNDAWYESKYVSLSMETVKISSFDQLDTDLSGFLALCRLEKTAETIDGYLTLNSIVNAIIEMSASNENTMVTFKNRLALYGYNSDNEQYDQPYILHRFEIYSVDCEFPRIRRSMLPGAITGGEYLLSIPALQQWKEELD